MEIDTYFYEISFFHQYSDMSEEMKSECVELSMTACEKFANNYEVNGFCLSLTVICVCVFVCYI